jgi:hypothetical protein
MNDLKWPDAPAKNVILYSKHSNKRQIARAIFQPSCSTNLISHRILIRLGLKKESKSGVVATPVAHDQDFTQANPDWIDIAYRSQGCDGRSTYRFYIVSKLPFDLLLGCGASAQSGDPVN